MSYPDFILFFLHIYPHVNILYPQRINGDKCKNRV